MPVRDLSRYQRKRLSPFRGLVIDVPVWNDAHNYHRDQHRLHTMSSHSCGVVTGLEVVAWNPPDNSVVIYPGVAVDDEGNTIVLPQAQRFYIKTEERGLALITVRYSEIAPEVAAKTVEEELKPAYTTEAYRIEEQRHRPAEAFIELARLDIEGDSRTIRDPADPYTPGRNEIDMRYRTVSAAKPAGEIRIGLLRYPVGEKATAWKSHETGVMNLVQSIQQNTAHAVRLIDAVDLKSEILDCDLLIMTGYGEFHLPDGERQILVNYFKRGGVLFAEPCPGSKGAYQDKLKDFRSSFVSLCDQLGQSLRTVERDHPVLRSCHLFGACPPGPDGTAVVMATDSILFSFSDYGCAWDGGRDGQPLARQAIRDALEFGTNIAAYAHRRSRLHAIRIVGN